MVTKSALQHIRALRDKKTRDEAALYVVEGEKLVADLCAQGVLFEAVYATAEWADMNIPVVEKMSDRLQLVTISEMARMTHLTTPSPVLALGRQREHVLDPNALLTGYTLALDGVQDPGNVGTLLRVADWYGLDRVLLSPECADPYSGKVLRSSMASFARIPFFTVDLAELLATTAKRVPVVGCVMKGNNLHTWNPPSNAILVIGSEGRGLSDAVAAHLAESVTIPRFGGAESLNAGIAAAVVCDTLRRCHPGSTFPPLTPPCP